MKIAVIDYGASNLQSVCNALGKIGQKYGVVRRVQEIGRYSKVILPGVGAAGSAMQKLLETGLIEILPGLEVSFLGICLGMQLLAESSEEDDTQCLFAIPGKVKRFPPDTTGYPRSYMPNTLTRRASPEGLSLAPSAASNFRTAPKIPQIGWNKVNFMADSPLFDGVTDNSFFYFVHSFYFDAPEKYIIAKTNYGLPFASVVQKNNFYGVQFHPEKSGDNGLQLLRNFCEKC